MMTVLTMIRVRQSSGLLKYPGRHETSKQRTTESHKWWDFKSSPGSTSCSNGANFYVQAGFEGPWLAESARKFWTNSLTVHLSTFFFPMTLTLDRPVLLKTLFCNKLVKKYSLFEFTIQPPYWSVFKLKERTFIFQTTGVQNGNRE